MVQLHFAVEDKTVCVTLDFVLTILYILQTVRSAAGWNGCIHV